MPMIPPKVKRLLVPVSIAIAVLTFAYLMRNVPVPPDCMMDPEDTACAWNGPQSKIDQLFFSVFLIGGVVVVWLLVWRYAKRTRGVHDD